MPRRPAHRRGWTGSARRRGSGRPSTPFAHGTRGVRRRRVRARRDRQPRSILRARSRCGADSARSRERPWTSRSPTRRRGRTTRRARPRTTRLEGRADRVRGRGRRRRGRRRRVRSLGQPLLADERGGVGNREFPTLKESAHPARAPAARCPRRGSRRRRATRSPARETALSTTLARETASCPRSARPSPARAAAGRIR